MSPEVLLELKIKYGPLYAISVKGIDLCFRELRYHEFDVIQKMQESNDYSTADCEDYVLQATIVYPENFNIDKIPAGAVSSISEEILEISGFGSARHAKRVLNEKRAKASEVRGLMKAFVLATITAYSPEDLDNMSFSELAEKVALAEKIIEIQQSIYGIEPTQVQLNLIDPEEEREKERARAANYNASRKQGEAAYEDPVARKLWSGM